LVLPDQLLRTCHIFTYTNIITTVPHSASFVCDAHSKYLCLSLLYLPISVSASTSALQLISSSTHPVLSFLLLSSCCSGHARSNCIFTCSTSYSCSCSCSALAPVPSLLFSCLFCLFNLSSFSYFSFLLLLFFSFLFLLLLSLFSIFLLFSPLLFCPHLILQRDFVICY